MPCGLQEHLLPLPLRRRKRNNTQQETRGWYWRFSRQSPKGRSSVLRNHYCLKLPARLVLAQCVDRPNYGRDPTDPLLPRSEWYRDASPLCPNVRHERHVTAGEARRRMSARWSGLESATRCQSYLIICLLAFTINLTRWAVSCGKGSSVPKVTRLIGGALCWA